MKLLYRPVGTIVSVVGGLIAAAAFKQLWRRVAHQEEAPKPTDRDRGWSEIVAAAAVQGAIFGAAKALVDRSGAAGYARLTGVWPGEQKSAKKDGA